MRKEKIKFYIKNHLSKIALLEIMSKRKKNEKMKQLKKETFKILKLFLVIVTVLAVLNYSGSQEISAASDLEDEANLTINRILRDVEITELDKVANFAELTLGGSTGFCMDSGLVATSNYKYTKGGAVTNSVTIQGLNWYYSKSLNGFQDQYYALAQAIFRHRKKILQKLKHYYQLLKKFGMRTGIHNKF